MVEMSIYWILSVVACGIVLGLVFNYTFGYLARINRMLTNFEGDRNEQTIGMRPPVVSVETQTAVVDEKKDAEFWDDLAQLEVYRESITPNGNVAFGEDSIDELRKVSERIAQLKEKTGTN